MDAVERVMAEGQKSGRRGWADGTGCRIGSGRILLYDLLLLLC